VTDTSKLAVGWGVEGAGIGAGVTVASILNASTITLSANATTTSVSNTLTFLPHGRASATTFNVPDARGVFLRGAGTSGVSNYGGVSGHTPSAGSLGTKGGQKTAVNGLFNSSSPVEVSGNVSVSGSTSSAGLHSHNIVNATSSSGGGTRIDGTVQLTAAQVGGNGQGDEIRIFTDNAPSHTHSVSSSGNNAMYGSAEPQFLTGESETTPAYFAVNHIIKI
jgi:hypothetical protein